MDNSIKYFFNDIDSFTYNNPTELAKNFLLYISTNTNLKEHIAFDENIFVLSDDNSLEFITKRCLLISGNLLLTNKSNFHTKIHTDYSNIESGYACDYYTYNNDLHALGLWLQKVKSLLISGHITYIPCAFKHLYDCDCLGNKLYDAENYDIINLDNIPKNIIQSRKLITTAQNINSPYLKPILNIEIPIINNIDLESYSNIILDNLDSLETFQTYLKLAILNADDLSPNNIAKISLDIQAQLNDIKHIYTKAINSSKIKSIIGGVATITAVLFYINPQISEIIKLIAGIGGGSGLIPLLQSNFEYFTLNDNLKDNKCYFLWVLKNRI